MPQGARHLKASSHINVEFSTNPGANTLCEAVPELMFHYAWTYLDKSSIVNLCKAAKVMSVYSKLRYDASRITPEQIHDIRRSLNHRIPVTNICKIRSNEVAMLLLLCNFDTGLLIRCLGGNYTSEFLDYASIDASLLALSSVQPDKGEPIHNFSRLSQLFHEHVPFKANFQCSRADMLFRNLYNNHRASDPYLPSIHKKSAVDIQKSYAIALPRWSLRFLKGLFIAALGYATREMKGKIKGRQVNDPSALLSGPDDTGALNSHIDRNDKT